MALIGAAPPFPGCVDVALEYGAKGDGATDSSDALQKAFDDHTGSGRILYLRPGVYLVSRTISVKKGENRWGHTHLWGAGAGRTIVRLKDGVFADEKEPKPVLTWERHGSADWFHNSVQDLTIETGKRNPGAKGIEFYSNNTGVMRRVHVKSGDGSGAIGIDLAHGDMNGPLLVASCRVEGFKRGLNAGFGVNSQTIEGLELLGQTEAGLVNGGQCLAARRVTVRGAPVPIKNVGGWSHLTLVDSRLEGSGAAAVVSDGYLALKNVSAPGFQAVAEQNGKPVGRNRVALYGSHASGPAVEFPEAKDPPAVPTGLTRALAVDFGAKPNDRDDDSEGIQRALDSGAAEVVLPHGSLWVDKPLVVPPTVRRIVGSQCFLIPAEELAKKKEPVFLVRGQGQPLFLEYITTGFSAGLLSFIRHEGARPLVLRDLQVNFQGSDAITYEGLGTGSLFIENVVGGNWQLGRQSVWARQLNVENEGVKIRSKGARLWLLGFKTERGGPLLVNSDGGIAAILGGLCYTTTAGRLGPMFVNQGGTLSVSIGEACFNGDPYAVILDAERTLTPKDLPSRAFGAALTWVSSKKN